MSESDDILHKTDALLVRYRGAPSVEEDVPLLTDIIDEPTKQVTRETASPGSESLAAAPAPFPAHTNLAIEEQVISAAMGRIASVLDERLLQITSEVRAIGRIAVEEAVREALEAVRREQSK